MQSGYLGRLHGGWPVGSMVGEKGTAWSVPIGMWQARTENDSFKGCNIYVRMDVDREKWKMALFRTTTAGNGTRLMLFMDLLISSQEGYKMRKRRNPKKWGLRKMKPYLCGTLSQECHHRRQWLTCLWKAYFFQGVNKRLPWPTQGEPFFHIHVLMMGTNLSYFAYGLVPVLKCLRILMTQVSAVFCHDELL